MLGGVRRLVGLLVAGVSAGLGPSYCGWFIASGVARWFAGYCGAGSGAGLRSVGLQVSRLQVHGIQPGLKWLVFFRCCGMLVKHCGGDAWYIAGSDGGNLGWVHCRSLSGCVLGCYGLVASVG